MYFKCVFNELNVLNGTRGQLAQRLAEAEENRSDFTIGAFTIITMLLYSILEFF